MRKYYIQKLRTCILLTILIIARLTAIPTSPQGSYRMKNDSFDQALIAAIKKDFALELSDAQLSVIPSYFYAALTRIDSDDILRFVFESEESGEKKHA